MPADDLFTHHATRNTRAYMPPSESVEWGTPWDKFNPWNEEFHFTVDVCARDYNTKVPQRWYSPEQNGLLQPWFGEVVWCNPPYGFENIEEWLAKATHEREHNTTTVLLLPNTTENKWFHRYVWDTDRNRVKSHVELRFIQGRINFDMPPGAEKKSQNVKGSILVIIRPKLITVGACPMCGK